MTGAIDLACSGTFYSGRCGLKPFFLMMYIDFKCIQKCFKVAVTTDRISAFLKQKKRKQNKTKQINGKKVETPQ